MLQTNRFFIVIFCNISGRNVSYKPVMTDSELVIQVLNGNQHACRYLVVSYQKLVAHMVRRILVCDADVEDLCQDVFMKVFSRLPGYRGDSKLSTWIATIAYNTTVTYLKKKKGSKELKQDPAGIRELKEITTTGSDDWLEAEEIKRNLLQTVDTLPVHYRSILTLFYLEEFSYREIEQITGMSEATVKSHLFRARSLLKCKLEKMQKSEKVLVYAE